MAKYKYILTVIITLCTLITYAQPAQYTPMTAAGYQMKRLKVDSTLHLPSFCGFPTLRGSTAKEGALAIDTCGGFLFIWTNENGWDTIGGSGGGGTSTDTTSLSNRINQRIDSLKRSNDSIFARKNGVFIFQYKDSGGTIPTLQQVTTAGATTTNQISVAGLSLGPLGNGLDIFGNTNQLAIKNGGTSDNLLEINYGATASLRFGGGTYNYVKISNNSAGNVNLTAPTTSGTIPMSVNGNFADLTGAITIPTGSVAVDTIYRTLGKDSIFYKKNGITYSIKDSVGGGGVSTDTTSLSNRINLKLNISDTASMLSPYLRKIDTTNKFVNRITRTLGKDSIIYFIGGTRYAIKDSVGGGSSQNGRFGNDTATVVMVKVHNESGTILTNGKVVAFSHSGTQSNEPAVRLANNKHDSTSANTLGFVSGTIAINDTGWVILSGKIEKLNTSAYSNGDIIYLDSINGVYTNVKPIAPYHMVYLGVVVKSNAGNGSIFVKVQNGYELYEIHDVKITSALNNQVLAYSDTQKVWKNRNIYSIVDTVSLSNRINLKLNKTDTASLSNRINEKLTNLDLLQSLSYGIKAEPYGVTFANVTSTLALTSTGMHFYPFIWNVSDTIRGIAFFNRIVSLAVTPTNYNGVAIYSLSGTNLIRQTFTANSGTFWDNAVANTWKTQSFTPFLLAKGTYYLGYQVSATSGLPTIASGTIMQTGFIEPPSAINANGIKIASSVPNNNTSPQNPIAISSLTTTQRVPYFILY